MSVLTKNCFPYQWMTHGDEIHAYCLTESNEAFLLRIIEFTPYVYVKLKNNVNWSPTNVSRLVQTLQKQTRTDFVKTSLVYKRQLYFADVHLDDQKTLSYNKHPYLLAAFATEKQRRNFTFNVNKLKTICVMGVGDMAVEVYENNASPVLQLTCVRGISTSDWFSAKNIKPVDEPITRLKQEYTVHWKGLAPSDSGLSAVPAPLILSYDIETVFHNPNAFSDGSHPNDTCFQISCVFGRQSEPKEKWERYLLTLGKPDESLLKGIHVLTFKKEFQLLIGFCNLVVQKNPQFLIGYNIFKFDIPFLMKRAEYLRVHDEFTRHGCTREKCGLQSIKWSSSAYSNQEMTFIDLQGRVTVDLLVLIQRDYNLESYKLDAVAEKFVKANKDPLNHEDIYTCFQMGMVESQSGVSKSMALVGKYCVKDSELVLDLFEKLQYWYSLVEMAKICQVPTSHLFLYGQQLKVFSQVYKYCYHNGIVVESGRFKANEDDVCMGAYVLTPEPGLYDNVVSFDFQSLYPSVIISHNIDFTTLIPETQLVRLLPQHYKTIEWEEHINCTCPKTTISKDSKDVRCKRYRYHWLSSLPGVLPTIIKNLLQVRKEVRNQMKSVNKQSALYDILNKRQLAYKVSANSMYGALSTKRGYLPFMPAGMCVTAVGRQSIEKVSRIIQDEHQGKVIYGDTDSNYVVFPHLTSLKDIWDHSIQVSDAVSKHFPEPMRLEFEDNIYSRYLILSKKRYLYFTVTPDGEVSSKIENKGVLLKRRDNSRVVRDIYERVIRMVLNRAPEIEVVSLIVDFIARVYARIPAPEDFSMSKSVKGIEHFHKSYRDARTIQYGDYVAPRLKENAVDRAQQLAEKNAVDEEQFYQMHLPGAVQLALRMRSRGQHIESGSRLSYVVTRRVPHSASVADKMEEIEYFKRFYTKQMVDVLHYLHLMINPLEEVLMVMYGKRYKNFIKDQYKYHIKYDMVVDTLYKLFRPINMEK